MTRRGTEETGLSLCVHASPFWDASLEDLMTIADSCGARALECRLGARQGHGVETNLSDEACAEMRRILGARGLGIVLGTDFSLGADPPEALGALLSLADRLGAGRLRIFVDDQIEGESVLAWSRRIRQAAVGIGSMTADSAALLMAENQGHTGCCSRLADMLPSEISILWDVGYSLKAGESADDAMVWSSRIAHVHLKDLRCENAKWVPARLGEGDADIAGIVGRLVARGFVGCVSIETRSDAPLADLEFAARAVATAKRT